MALTTSYPEKRKSGNQLSAKSILTWRVVQTIVWLVGVIIFVSLLMYPELGILLFWNILIPIAPALLVLSVGLWRNICPLASTNLMPRHFNLSKQKIMQPELQAKLSLLAVIALYLIVPLRHALFNTNGPATALLLFSCVATGFTMGFFYDWKSGWCSSLCPIHPVEKLYGGNTLISIPNAHCAECVNCTVPCPDSTPNFHPALTKKITYNKISALLIIGGLPGFIWGWFHVPDHSTITNFSSFINIYTFPGTGLLATLSLYLILRFFLKDVYERTLISIFAASAVSCYYWYRIPALFGFGKFSNDGLLINLTSVLSQNIITAIGIVTTLFFFWWLVGRKSNQLSWVIRPEFKVKPQ